MNMLDSNPGQDSGVIWSKIRVRGQETTSGVITSLQRSGVDTLLTTKESC